MKEIEREPVMLEVASSEAEEHYLDRIDDLLGALDEIAWCGDLAKVFGPELYRMRGYAKMVKEALLDRSDVEIEVLDLADGTHREIATEIERDVVDYPRKFEFFAKNFPKES